MSRFLCLFLLAEMASCNDTNIDVTAGKDSPKSIVDAYCKARENLDAAEMNKYLADTVYQIPTEGEPHLYDHKRMYEICDWEKGMNTTWNHEILGEDSNIVTVLLKERSDYFKFLGLDEGVQVSQYHVYQNKIIKSVSKLYITRTSSQDVEYPRFKSWLYLQPGISEPLLMRPDTTLIYNKASAPRMQFWLKKYHEATSKSSN